MLIVHPRMINHVLDSDHEILRILLDYPIYAVLVSKVGHTIKFRLYYIVDDTPLPFIVKSFTHMNEYVYSDKAINGIDPAEKLVKSICERFSLDYTKVPGFKGWL